MTISYDEIVPWGRNYDEYCRMFALSPEDLKKRILGCGDGPASFNSVANAAGGRVVSVDPLYGFSREQIEQRIKETWENVIQQTRRNQDRFKWDQFSSVDELGSVRMSAMQEFLASYNEGKAEGKYVDGALPSIDFPDDSFDLALSSHFLFLYSGNLPFDFHVAAITEMLRVAPEVRIFPLVDVNADRSPYVQDIAAHFSGLGLAVEIRRVDYEFQIGGNEMMVLSGNNGE